MAYIKGVSEKYNERFERLQREPVILVHIDTTGLDAKKDHISRLTIIADDMLLYSQVFKCDTSRMSHRAAEVSGISAKDIANSPVTFVDELDQIRDMLASRLICCTSKDFLLAFLAAEGLSLCRDDVIDLKAIVGMMNHTYSRTTMADVLDTLLPADANRQVPDTTFERNFKMYECACNLKDIVSLHA